MKLAEEVMKAEFSSLHSERRVPAKLWSVPSFVLIAIAFFLIYYTYRWVSSTIGLDLSGDAGWQWLFAVEDDVLVPLWARVGHILLWLPTVIATIAMILSAMVFVWRIRQGAYFTENTIRSVQMVGVLAAIAGAMAQISFSFDGWWLTQFNAAHKIPISFRFLPGEMGVFLVGFGIFMLGWVLRSAMVKKLENSEII